MKKTNKKLIFLGTSIALLTSMIAITFAAYTFKSIIDVSNEVGDIYNVEKHYLNYANDMPSTVADEIRQGKLRRDTVLVFDDIAFDATTTYDFTSDSYFVSGKTYYKLKSGSTTEYEEAEVTIGAEVTANTYYELSRTYNGISSVGMLYDKDYTTYTPTISGYEITVVKGSNTIKATITASDGLITAVNLTTTATSNYRTVIDSDNLGFSIFDNEITATAYNEADTTIEYGYKEIAATDKITCSATDKKSDSNNMYLSQLGLEFSFETDIAVYVRIHIEDAWKRTRAYSTSTKVLYILKDQVAGESPFAVKDSDWYYDAENNYAYLKEMYVPNFDTTTSTTTDSNRTTFVFNVYEAYSYQTTKTTSFTEYVDVEVSFQVDIVQANRVKEVWGIDPNTYFSG